MDDDSWVSVRLGGGLSLNQCSPSSPQVAFALIDRHIPAIANLMWVEAFNLRLGTQNLRTSDLWQTAAQRNMTSSQVPTIVEQDSWQYHTTRYNKTNPVMGPSMVCCVFACAVWKAAGVFGDMEVNCGELTVSGAH